MPSLSASVPKANLKVMRKPVARQPASGGAVSAVAGPKDINNPANQAAGQQARVDSVALQNPNAAGVRGVPGGGGGPNPAGGFRGGSAGFGTPGWKPPVLDVGMDGMGNVRPDGRGGFQFRPRDTVGGTPPAGLYEGLQSGRPPMPGAGADIQTAIKSLRGQLGIPMSTDDAATGPTLEPWQQGGGSPAVPAWKQLADLGVGGQGSAAGNRAKLAELLAARTGGSGAAGVEPGGAISSGQPNLPTIPGVPPGTSIRRMPATVSDSASDLGVGDGGASLAGNQGPMGPGLAAPAGPGQNPYMDILSRRLGGFGGGAGRPGGGYGSGGFNPVLGAAVQYAR